MKTARTTSRSQKAGWLMVAAVMAVIGAAGVLKAADLAAFHDTVQTWQLLGPVTRWTVVLTLPVVEMVMALLWFLRVEPRRMEAVAVVLLVAFAATYGAHLALTEPPRCGCFGLIDEYFKGLSVGRAALWRDGAMIATLGVGLWLTRRPGGDAAGRDAESAACRREAVAHAVL